MKSEIFMSGLFLSIGFRFDTKSDQLIGSVFDLIQIGDYQNSLWSTNCDPNLTKRTVNGQFKPKPTTMDPKWTIWTQIISLNFTKTDRGWPILTRIYQNGPWLAYSDLNLSKQTVIDQFGPKMGRSRSILVDLGPNRPITVRFGRFWSALANHSQF